MENADPSLLSLCAICHVNPHVYKCPRCSVLTCSLACVKRHKKWAQCNGTRDPAAYVQISDLATPAGIDKDYNYLTSLERALDTAEKTASQRGIPLQDAIVNRSRGRRGWQGLQAGYERSRAIIMKAPKGMSREKTNMTRWLKGSQQLDWTVEWVHPDGTKELGHCTETSPISQVYEALRNAKMGRKRRHNAPPCDHMNESIEKATLGLPADSNDIQQKHEREPAAKVEAGGTEEDTKESPRIPEAKDEAPSEQQKTVEIVQDDLSSESPPPSFFLHAPSLPTKKTVLIPLSREATLHTALRERVILEYPTIFVMSPTSDVSLPEAYILEDEYLKVARKDAIEELEDGEIGLPPAKEEVVNDRKPPEAALDSKKILEMLAKDIGVNN